MNKLKNISSAVILSFALLSNVSAAESTKDIKIEIDGKNVISDVAPFINNERTLVPIRVISENLGYNVNWDNNSRKVTVKNSDKTIELFIGKKNVSVNGVDNSIDVAPMIKNERTFVPLRFISESFDNDVKWDNNTRTVKINKKNVRVDSIITDNKDSSKIVYSNLPQKNEKSKDNTELFNDWYKQQGSNIRPDYHIDTMPRYNTNNSNRYYNSDYNRPQYSSDTQQNYIQKSNLGEMKNISVKYRLDVIQMQIDRMYYQPTLEKKIDERNHIQKQLDTLTLDDTSTARARRIKLKKQLEEKDSEIEAFQKEHSYLLTKQGLLQNLYDYNAIASDENAIKRYNDYTENKLSQLDAERNSYLYTVELVQMINKRNKNLERFNTLTLDDTSNGRGRRIKLKEEIEELDYQIGRYRNQNKNIKLMPYAEPMVNKYDVDVDKDIRI